MTITKDAVFFGSSIFVLIITIIIATMNLIAVKDMPEDSADKPKVLTAGILAALVSAGIAIGMLAYFLMEREYPPSKNGSAPPSMTVDSWY